MSTWHTYPTYLRLGNGSCVPVVLMFEPATGDLVGGTVADTNETVSTWIRDLAAARGMPGEVLHVEDANFPGLSDAIGAGLADGGYHHVSETHPDPVHVGWVIDAGGRVSAAVRATHPATAQDVISALRQQVSLRAAPVGQP